ncbi:hypothetical protein B566_EDAN001054, partial [Ephemera danica]
MSKPLRALTLVTCKNDKLILHEDVLKRVLEKSMNRPVAIISIAGEFRKGKSFFLNFILRYLKSKGDLNWIGSHLGHLDGFDWRPDHEGVTSGITIWPEVFVVNDIAVVLIDTQGLYESSKNTLEDTYIMVLSFLLSSIQILNHQENLKSTDLKNFEFFAKYGMALECKSTNIKGFQNLMFLIRDWKYEKLHSYGLKCGNEYLEKFLKTNINEELHSVRETLKHFKKVDCFLMPYPGETVARKDDFKGDIEQIETTFLDNMKELVQTLIANVKPKELLGKKANGECVFQVMRNYVKCLNDGELPAPKSLIQIQLDILQNSAEKECLMIYNDGMTKGTNDKLLKNDKMDELHSECAEAALKVFDNLPDFGNQDEVSTAKSKCSQMIESSEYKSRMEEKVKHHVYTLITSSEKECLAIYNSGMMKGTSGKLLNNADMDNLHKDCATTALLVFDTLPDLGHQNEIIAAKSQVSKLIEASDYKNRMEEKVQTHMNTLQTNAEKECMIIYNDGMTKATNGKFLNNIQMYKLHNEIAAEALKVFDQLPLFGNQYQMKDAKSQCS